MAADNWSRPKDAPLAIVEPIPRLNERFEDLEKVMREVLVEGRDWGMIPGAKGPSLVKTGAEMLCEVYGLTATYEIMDQERDHEMVVEWEKEVWQNGSKVVKAGTSRGVYSFTIRCTLTDSGREMVVAQAIGHCSSMESRYIDRPRELGNTLIRMAMKRALVAAVYEAVCLSHFFTASMDGTVKMRSMGKPAGDRRPPPQQQQQRAPSPAPPPAAPSPPAPPPAQEGERKRIPEASGVPFKKVRDAGELVGWVREDTGQLLRVCPECQSPLLELTQGMHTCVLQECGTVLDNGQVQPAREGMSKEGLSPRNLEEERRRAQELTELGIYREKWAKRKESLSWYDWQVEAVVAFLRMKDQWDTWGPKDYADLLESTEKRSGELLAQAVAKMAGDVPLIPERAEQLRMMADQAKAGIGLRAEIETAIASGWNDPVTDLIDRLDAKIAQPPLL